MPLSPVPAIDAVVNLWTEEALAARLAALPPVPTPPRAQLLFREAEFDEFGNSSPSPRADAGRCPTPPPRAPERDWTVAQGDWWQVADSEEVQAMERVQQATSSPVPQGLVTNAYGA